MGRRGAGRRGAGRRGATITNEVFPSATRKQLGPAVSSFLRWEYFLHLSVICI